MTHDRLFFLRYPRLAVLFALPAIGRSFCVTCDWPFFSREAPNSTVRSKPVGQNQPAFCITLFSTPTKNNNLMIAALLAFSNGDEVNERGGGGERLSFPPHQGFSSLIVDLCLKYPRWRPCFSQRNTKRSLFKNEYVLQGGLQLTSCMTQLMAGYTRNWVPVPFSNPRGQISENRKSSPRPSKTQSRREEERQVQRSAHRTYLLEQRSKTKIAVKWSFKVVSSFITRSFFNWFTKNVLWFHWPGLLRERIAWREYEAS